MKRYRRQFASNDEAISYLEERGKLVYFGREGLRAEKYCYTLTLPNRLVYHLFVYEDGLVEVHAQRYE
ncbi:hypothetical protein ACP26L_36000 (plasmid) [Paenibacillus sp. S-38]|uniref:hypothetical protein n=1 Tax=Paenibacillus sp. S-38 TaxID=3416710 RepID=UPI003CEE51A4